LMWTILWKGNSRLSQYLSRKIPWIQFPVRRFVVGIIVTITFTVLAVVSLILTFEYFAPRTIGEADIYTLYGSIVVTILISVFLHARQFFFFWRRASSEKEMFEKETIAARYESLKNQVSPHFLFNSLNALTNLVYEDQDKAVKFIKQLSEVYRYVLDTRGKEVVPIEDELRFLESYIFLQQIRFGSRLNVDISMADKNIKVAPLALQMLMENAIKHNIISDAMPLTIRLYSENGFVVVENSLQRKTSIHGESSGGVGLVNICRRYQFLSNVKVQVVEDNRKFVVRLPVLKESYP
jgi:sensor histidine kinase YesM